MRRAWIAVAVFSLALSGCAMRGFSIERAVPDRAIITGSVRPVQREESTGDGDANTIRNAVSATNLEELAGRPIPWANPDTGSNGFITSIVERRGMNGLCRSFRASRVAFNGVTVFRGEACMDARGNWKLNSFEQV